MAFDVVQTVKYHRYKLQVRNTRRPSDAFTEVVRDTLSTQRWPDGRALCRVICRKGLGVCRLGRTFRKGSKGGWLFVVYGSLSL